MIKSWKHKDLKKFFETGNPSGIQAKHAYKLRLRLANLDQAIKPTDMNLPGYAFHSLAGNLSDYYSISVDGGWRLIFQFANGNATLVNYLNYH